MRWLLLFAALLCPGCQSSNISDTMPAHYTLALTTAGANQQFTFFKLDADDVLHFAGGRDVITRATKPLLKVTPLQREALWNLVVRYGLHKAKGELFLTDGKVKYELTIKTGSMFANQKLNAADNEVPGLAELHQYLMAVRAGVKLDSPLPGPD
ncbi:MAG: hypothetical protein WD768_13970 [Phycisphaeraceae bacterium]